MSSDLSCSFASFCDSRCDISSRYPGFECFFPLQSCVKDVRAHLRSLKVTQSVASERVLILSRAGFFDVDGQHMTICPKHRCVLGEHWKPSRKCQHPLHRNRNQKPERGVNLKMSKEIKTKWKVLVPIGAGMNTTCEFFYLNFQIIHPTIHPFIPYIFH